MRFSSATDLRLIEAVRAVRLFSTEPLPASRRDFFRSLSYAGMLLAAAQVAKSAPQAQDDPRPQPPPLRAPDAASSRTKELVAKMSIDMPPQIQVAHSISYRLSTRVDADQRRLDIYRNMNSGKNPVVIFIHGGAWRSGHRRQYVPLGVSLALKRITAVIPSYSLAPKYQFPEPVRDAASVVSWVHDNIEKLGGNPDKIFLAGHSSGVQIAALAALDPHYLLFHNLPTTVIRGVIALSGIYEVPPGFEYAFGASEESRAQASPSRFIREGAPPFLVVRGGHDTDIVVQQSPLFVARLKSAGISVEDEVYPEEDHNSIIALASIRNSEIIERILRFVKEHS